MMEKLMTDKGTSLLRLVEEKVKLEQNKKKQKLSLVPYLPEDCISNILGRLPHETLQRLRFVCKPWYKIVRSPVFIDAHLRRIETVLIFLSSVREEASHPSSTTSILPEKTNTLSVEAKLFQLQSVHVFQQPRIPASKFYIKFMEMKDGKSKIGEFNVSCLGKIRASCNGLILLDNKMKKGGLIIVNPVTRELTALPLGTLFPSHHESYGLVFCKCTREYKLVHLFRDEMQFISCEILKLGTMSWRVVDGPSFGLFSWFGYQPIFAIGALHWVPHVDHSEYVVSMEIDEEKFHKILLPKSSRKHDRVVEMGGHLCFVTHEDMKQIDVWILRNLRGEDWTKKYTIAVGCRKDLVPLYCSRFDGKMIFKGKDGSLYAYDFQFQVMKKVEMEKGCFAVDGCYLPHVNSLVSWREEKGQDVVDD